MPSWQKLMWKAVNKCDHEEIRSILLTDKVQEFLKGNSEQVYYNEEAPLHLAAYHGHTDLIILMVAYGMDINSYNVYTDKTMFKITPLHWAIYTNKVGTVKCLLSYGADPKLMGKWGYIKGSPLHFARTKKCKEIIKLLQQYLIEDDPKTLTKKRLEFSRNVLETKKKALILEISELEKKLSTLGQSNSLNNDSNDYQQKDNETTMCPVCFKIPKDKIFSCDKCENIICHLCKEKLNQCPFCRVCFHKIPPKRNRWAERFVKLESQVSNTN